MIQLQSDPPNAALAVEAKNGDMFSLIIEITSAAIEEGALVLNFKTLSTNGGDGSAAYDLKTECLASCDASIFIDGFISWLEDFLSTPTNSAFCGSNEPAADLACG